MARKKTPTLTDGELRLMEIIWDRGEATVGEILDQLTEATPPAYNTVLTIMRILEQKGYVSHVKQGRAFVYRPLIDRNLARAKAVKYLVSSFFNNSPEQLMLSILKNEGLTPDELQHLKKMIEETK